MKIFTRIFFLSFLVIGLRLFGYSAVSGNVTLPKTQTSVQSDRDKMAVSLEAYPNPSRGEVVFTLLQPVKENYKIRISNAIGRVVKTIDIKDNGQQIETNLTDLPSGLYFYSLTANDKMVETKRLILQH